MEKKMENRYTGIWEYLYNLTLQIYVAWSWIYFKD